MVALTVMTKGIETAAEWVLQFAWSLAVKVRRSLGGKLEEWQVVCSAGMKGYQRVSALAGDWVYLKG